MYRSTGLHVDCVSEYVLHIDLGVTDAMHIQIKRTNAQTMFDMAYDV